MDVSLYARSLLWLQAGQRLLMHARDMRWCISCCLDCECIIELGCMNHCRTRRRSWHSRNGVDATLISQSQQKRRAPIQSDYIITGIDAALCMHNTDKKSSHAVKMTLVRFCRIQCWNASVHQWDLIVSSKFAAWCEIHLLHAPMIGKTNMLHIYIWIGIYIYI